MPEKARTEIWNTDTTLDEDGIHKGPECKRNNTSHPVQWIDATRRIRQNPATERSMDVAATHVSDQSNTANTTKSCQWAIYGCGCNSCGCSLRSSEVRLGSIWGRLGALWPQSRPTWIPDYPQPDHGQPQSAPIRVATNSIDRRTKGLSANETIQGTHTVNGNAPSARRCTLSTMSTVPAPRTFANKTVQGVLHKATQLLQYNEYNAIRQIGDL